MDRQPERTPSPPSSRRRPGWGAGSNGSQLSLEALAAADAGQLLDELLGVGLPASLREMVVERAEGTMEERIFGVMHQCIGAFSIVLATERQLFAFRAPWGVRPLCLGRYGEGWAFASESCALATIGAQFEREIKPGELAWIDEGGVHSRMMQTGVQPATCAF